MLSKNLAFLTLSAASTVWAAPQYSHASGHGTGFHGTGHHGPRPTGHVGNSTDSARPTLTSTDLVVVTSTVNAAAADVSTQAAIAAADLTPAADAQTATSCTSFSTSTETATQVEFVTVTARNANADANANANANADNNGGPGGYYNSWNNGGWTRTWTHGQAPTTLATSTTPAAVVPSVVTSVLGGSASPVASSTGSLSGTKKGLSYNTASLLNLFNNAGASWAYNWAASADGSIPAGMEFVPMLWGSNSVSGWSSAVKTAIAGGAKAALSFNEPDLGSQSNMDPATAAKLHIANMNPLSGQVLIGSPAITNSGSAGQGLSWLQQFFTACNGQCKVDFIAFHWYGAGIDSFKSHVSDVANFATQNLGAGGKIWLTEFANQQSAADNVAFLKQAVPFLDSQSQVERYAYFMVSEGELLTNGAVNSLGQAYASSS